MKSNDTRSAYIIIDMLPLVLSEGAPFDFASGGRVDIPGARKAVESGADELTGYINGAEYVFTIGPLTKQEREILLAGCLMNWYAERRKK